MKLSPIELYIPYNILSIEYQAIVKRFFTQCKKTLLNQNMINLFLENLESMNVLMYKYNTKIYFEFNVLNITGYTSIQDHELLINIRNQDLVTLNRLLTIKSLLD